MRVVIENLRDISRRCLANEPLEAEQSHWLGACLEQFLGHRCRSIDDALGLRFPQGGVPWWREEGIRVRNAALRELAEAFFDGLSPCAQAHAIYVASVRYAASAWRFDREKDRPPSHYRGTIKEHLWRAFTAGAAMPVSERHLRTILGR